MPKDFPFDECVAAAKELIESGAVVFQKFTCVSCGSRQTIPVPNTFYASGSCEECGAVTNCKETGINYMVHIGVGVTAQEVAAAQQHSADLVRQRSKKH